MLRFRALVMAALTLALSGCTIVRETSPSRTATEQLLISTAAERAASALTLNIPPASRVYVDDRYFEGPDSKYAIAALRARLLTLGARLVAERPQAEVIVELRSGALSIDESKTLVGLPDFELPIPLAGPLGVPEMALYKKDVRQGVAKFAAIAYDAKGGELASVAPSQYGYAHETEWVFLLLFSRRSTDVMREEAR